MKNFHVLCLLFFIQSVCASIQVTENNAQRFSFIWDMEGFSIDDTSGDKAIISFKNQNVELGDSNQALIPAFSFYIGTPSQGVARASFTPMNTRSISLKHPLKIINSHKRISRYPDLHFDDRWLSDGRKATLGGIAARQFILRPFYYDDKNKVIQVLEKGSCIVEFPSTEQTFAEKASPNSDYSRMVSRVMLNYDIASRWAPPIASMKKRKGGAAFPLTPTANQPLITFSIGDGHDSINEGTIKENGIIKIPGTILQNLGSYVPIKQIAVYASYKGEMPTKTPGISELPDGVSEIPIMRFDLDSNNVVDPHDYILIYVTGSSDWSWDTSHHEYNYNLNRYEDYRHYWITLKKNASEGATLQRMTTVDAAEATTINSFNNHILFKMSKVISHRGGKVEKGEKSGLDWRWEMLTFLGSTFSYAVILPEIEENSPAQIRITKGDSNGSPSIKTTFSDSSICSACQWNGWEPSQWYPIIYSGNHTLKIEGSDFGTKNDYYIEIVGFEVKYDIKLDFSKDSRSMTVFSPESGSTVKYHLSNLPSEPIYIYRIDANENMSLVDSLHPVKGASFEWADSSGKGIKYFICAQSAFLPTPSWSLYNQQQSDELKIVDLRATENQADYLIISHSGFMDQARQLAKHKRKTGRFNATKIVDVSDIYRQFSGGNLDPAGIRNFLVFAHTQWSVRPDYIVLFGKGHYNFKSIQTSEPVYIPTFEDEDRCVEDFFAYLDSGETVQNGPTPDVYIGRFPCVTVEQATQMVNKIIDMEDSSIADFGAWRNRALLVNDDDKQVDNNQVVQDPLNTDHRSASDSVYNVISNLQPSVDIRKINLFLYPLNNVFQKPEARDALINDINGGVSVVNFFGHGSPLIWTDERILDQGTVASFHNEKMYPLISSFSCAVGQFDQPAQRCLSEVLALADKSGAIATISSTREAYSDPNKNLAMAIYTNLFIDTSQVNVTLGEAYTEAKLRVRDGNSQIYSFLGDPSIRLVNPLHRVFIDVLDKSNKSLDTLKTLQAITIRGSIRKKDQIAIDMSYGSTSKPASIQICLFNPFISLQSSTGTDVIPGTMIYSGQVDVVNGQFEQTLHLPRNVVFKKPGARVTAFSWQSFDNGMGYKPLIFNGTDTIGSVDTVGPTIALRLLDDDVSSITSTKSINAMSSGNIKATLPFKCQINVFDSSGIDISGTGPDEGLTIEIKDVLSKQNINNKLRIDGGDYRKGNATIDMNEGMLKTGTYTLWISAQDLAGNISRQSFTLEVSQNEEVAINHVFNYPNPVKMGKSTSFYFSLTKTTGITSTIKLYSLSGKLLRVFYGAHSGEVFNLRDQLGNPLAPNVYLYQLIVQDANSQNTVKSGIQKLCIHPPQ